MPEIQDSFNKDESTMPEIRDLSYMSQVKGPSFKTRQ